MSDCVFCKIVKGELPSYKVYEDDLFYGFLNKYPIARGNSLLIPKKHYRWTYDVPEFGAYWQAVKKITLASIKALKAESVSYLTLGYEIPHAHIWIIPRFPGDNHKHGIDIKAVQKISDSKMISIANQIYVLIKP